MQHPKTRTSDSSPSVPLADLWQGPISWTGWPAQPVQNYSRSFPADATFVRGEVIATLSEVVGPGVSKSSEEVRPALLHLAQGKPIEVHFTGFDGQSWTLRTSKVGRRQRWSLCVGSDFPALEPASPLLLQQYAFEQIVVQSLLPAAGAGKYISFAITDAFVTENFSSATDPDPND